MKTTDLITYLIYVHILTCLILLAFITYTVRDNQIDLVLSIISIVLFLVGSVITLYEASCCNPSAWKYLLFTTIVVVFLLVVVLCRPLLEQRIAPLPAEALEALGSNPDTAVENIPDDLPF
jgi:hypothetical protein